MSALNAAFLGWLLLLSFHGMGGPALFVVTIWALRHVNNELNRIMNKRGLIHLIYLFIPPGFKWRFYSHKEHIGGQQRDIRFYEGELNALLVLQE